MNSSWGNGLAQNAATMTRRHFLRDCQVGLGSIALNSLLGRFPDLSIVNLDALSYPLNPIFRGPEKLLARWQVS